MRKQRNQYPVIIPRIVEEMVASGLTLGEVAQDLNVNRGTITNYSRERPDLRHAIARGKNRWRNRKRDFTGTSLEGLLHEILRDVRALRGKALPGRPRTTQGETPNDTASIS